MFTCSCLLYPSILDPFDGIEPNTTLTLRCKETRIGRTNRQHKMEQMRKRKQRKNWKLILQFRLNNHLIFVGIIYFFCLLVLPQQVISCYIYFFLVKLTKQILVVESGNVICCMFRHCDGNQI